LTDQLLLKADNLETGYGKKQVLYGVSLEVGEGEIVAIIGPNGAGKSTVLKCVCGLLPAWSGSIAFSGDSIRESTPARNVARGITYCPQGSRIFGDLTVQENLEIGGFQLPRKQLGERMTEVRRLFPALETRLRVAAGKLSGGEQQMLAVARALMPRPRLLMLDEPSLGLSPNLIKDLFAKIAEINAETGVAILIVEQKVREVLGTSHRVYSLKLGEVAFAGAAEDLQSNQDKLKQLFL
jgi:branched-chain amino acid transport system ATP-binding protein